MTSCDSNLYQICHSRCSCFVTSIEISSVVSSLRVVAGLQRLISFPENCLLLIHFCQAYYICINFMLHELADCFPPANSKLVCY